jgi:hypothetical protein
MIVATIYWWKVELRQEPQGFGKNLSITAENYEDAIRKAFKDLERKGYDQGDFIVVSVVRGAVNRRIEA